MIMGVFSCKIEEIGFADNLVSTTFIIKSTDEDSLWRAAQTAARDFAFRYGKVREFTLTRLS